MTQVNTKLNALVTADKVVEAEHAFLNKRRAAQLKKRMAKPVTGRKAQREEADVAIRRTGLRKITRALKEERRDQVDSYLFGGVFDTVGLALSGGGIRSAAVCTGAMQALAKHKIFDRIDYLSTVSGGGYAGASVTVAMTHNGGTFPYYGFEDEKKDTAEMGQLRLNANYLKAGNFGEMAKNVVIYLRGIGANIIIVLPILLAIAAVVLLFNPTTKHLSRPDLWFVPDPIYGSNDEVARYFALVRTVLIGVFLFFVVWAARRGNSFKPELVSNVPRWAIIVLIIMGGVAFYELQPRLVDAMVQMVAQDPDKVKPGAVGFLENLVSWFTTLLAPMGIILGFLGQFVGTLLKAGESETGWTAFAKRYSGRIMQIVIGLSVPVLLWYLCLLLIAWGALAGSGNSDRVPPLIDHVASLSAKLPFDISAVALMYIVLAFAIRFLWRFLRPNSNSPHRLYKERLGEAFCNIGRNLETPQKLSELDTTLAPFHIINTAINVGGSKEANKNGRNADFFIFSPLFCGSPATDYAQVEDMEKLFEGNRDATIDMATAIATSGAAFSSNMGTQTIGWMTATLAMLNVRLGYWMPNPRQLSDQDLKTRDLYFLDELLGRLDEKSDVVYLSDGGHLENLGVYELLRRRCKLIIVVDAECDEELTFTSLAALQRFARIDLGVRIVIKWDDIQKQSVAIQQNKGKSQQGPHCAVGRVEYDNGGEGVLVYFKSSMSGDENDYVRDYNRRKKAFPHESTGDQFFNEEQFEVYRALGFHMVDSVFDGTDKVQTLTGLKNFKRAVGGKEVGEALELIGR